MTQQLLTIDRDTLLQLINRFYVAYDSPRQFDEAFSLYQSVISGDRNATDVMNALYETYPAAKANLMCQAIWRYRPAEFPSSNNNNNNNNNAGSSSTARPNLETSMKFDQIIIMLDSQYDGGIRPDLSPKNDQKRLSIQIREIVAAYEKNNTAANNGVDWSMSSTAQVIEQIESELGRPIFAAAAAASDDNNNASQEQINNSILKEVEQYYASKATDDEKQRAAFWRVVFESDVVNLGSIDTQIAACNGNAVQATRLFREQLRKSTVRIESNFSGKNAATVAGNNNDDEGGVSIPSDAAKKQASSRSDSQTPLPGSDARSSSAQDKKSIEHLRSMLDRGNASLVENEKRLREREQELAAKMQRTPEDLARFAAVRDELDARERDLQEVQQECQRAADRLNERQLQLEAWEKALTLREAEHAARQRGLAEREETHLAESQRRAEALQVSAAAVLRREQMADVKEHVVGQREAEARRREDALVEREHATDRRAEAIVQRSLELERLMAEYELRSLRVRQRETAIWKSYVNQQLASADPAGSLGGGSDDGSAAATSAGLQTLSKELKSVRGHLERLGTVAGSFVNNNNSNNNSGQQQQFLSTPTSNQNNNKKFSN